MAKCRHWWLLESAHGTPTVRGTCKFCGAVRDFPTTDDTSIWDGRGVAGFGQYRRRGDVEPIAQVNDGYW